MAMRVEPAIVPDAGADTEPVPSKRDTEDRRPTLTWRQHLITCALTTWMLSGLYLDGWAHKNIDLEDSITTPWHGVLYSGWLASATWLLWVGFGSNRAERPGFAGIPRGYGPGLLGVGIFTAGAIADQFWHLAWGVEQDLNAFLSPTHWGLAVGMFLMVSSPLRAAWHDKGSGMPSVREFLPTWWSMLLTTAMASFFVNYLSTFISDLAVVEPEFVGDLGEGVTADFTFVTVERLRSMAIAMIVLTTAILMGMALHAVRRWRLPPGTLTVVFGATAAAVNAVWEYPFGWVVIAGIVGGLVADILIVAIDPRPSDIRAYRWFAAAVPAVMWLTYYAIMKLAYDINWPAEMWTGTVVMASLASLMLSYLMEPGRTPAVDGGAR